MRLGLGFCRRTPKNWPTHISSGPLSKNCWAGIISYTIFLLFGRFNWRNERSSLDLSSDVRQNHPCVLPVNLAKRIAAHGAQRTKSVAAFGAPAKLNLMMGRLPTQLFWHNRDLFLRWLVFLPAIAFGAHWTSAATQATSFTFIWCVILLSKKLY